MVNIPGTIHRTTPQDYFAPFCTVSRVSFVPKDLSPSASTHLGNLQSILRDLVLHKETAPAHHVDLDPMAYDAALAWARATAAETLGSATSPTPGDSVSEELFVSILSLSPLTYQEFAFYVGLLEDALTVEAPWSQEFLARTDAELQAASARFDFEGELDKDTSSSPAAVLLLMYLRFHALTTCAATYLDVESIAERCAATVSVVLTTTRPAGRPS